MKKSTLGAAVPSSSGDKQQIGSGVVSLSGPPQVVVPVPPSTSSRSFTDVLNAMRDTEVIEQEKRLQDAAA